MTQILMIRHAEPSQAGCYIGRGSDPGLSETGKVQAQGVKEFLLDERVDSLWSSPMKRAVETILPTSRAASIAYHSNPGLSEMDFGEWEGMTWKDIDESDPLSFRRWLDDPWNTAPPGGETLAELSIRVVEAFDAILKEPGKRKIAVVCHGGPLRVLLGHVMGLTQDAWWAARIDYAGLCRFIRESNGKISLAQWNVPIGDVWDTESRL